MKRILALSVIFILSVPVLSQEVAGKWLIWEGSDGSELTVFLMPDGSGYAELSLTRRSLAVSHGEGSQFWGTFKTTGGYYFLVNGSKKVDVIVTQKDSTLTVTQYSSPTTSIKAWLDEAYSARDLSDFGNYKQQIVAQWKRDFPKNSDVKKQKGIMEHYFNDFYGDVFDLLLFGKYRIVEHTSSSYMLKNMDLDIPLMTWKRIQQYR